MIEWRNIINTIESEMKNFFLFVFEEAWMLLKLIVKTSQQVLVHNKYQLEYQLSAGISTPHTKQTWFQLGFYITKRNGQ